MRKYLIGIALLAIGATAQAETYHVNGVTIHVPTNCSSTSCVSVDAPEYGYRHEGRRAKARKERKDVKTATAPAKKDESSIPASSAPAAAVPTVAAPAIAEPSPARTTDTPAAAPTDTPAK